MPRKIWRASSAKRRPGKGGLSMSCTRKRVGSTTFSVKSRFRIRRRRHERSRTDRCSNSGCGPLRRPIAWSPRPHLDDRETRAGGLFRVPDRLRLYRHLSPARRLFYLHGGRIFRARGSESRAVFPLASVALLVSRPGDRNADVVGGTAPWDAG